jgi:hypothetical protein
MQLPSKAPEHVRNNGIPLVAGKYHCAARDGFDALQPSLLVRQHHAPTRLTHAQEERWPAPPRDVDQDILHEHVVKGAWEDIRNHLTLWPLKLAKVKLGDVALLASLLCLIDHHMADVRPEVLRLRITLLQRTQYYSHGARHIRQSVVLGLRQQIL